MRTLGVPYPEGYEDIAIADAEKQANAIVTDLQKAMPGLNTSPDLEIIALIAYLQRLGTDIKVKDKSNEKE